MQRLRFEFRNLPNARVTLALLIFFTSPPAQLSDLRGKRGRNRPLAVKLTSYNIFLAYLKQKSFQPPIFKTTV